MTKLELQALINEAETGNVQSQYDVGRLYFLGDEIEQNYELAAKWYKLAVEAGHSNAQQQYGMLHYYGYGVEQSLELAKYYYELAAAQENAAALHCLSLLYQFGEGVVQDLHKSKELRIRSAKREFPPAEYNMGIDARDAGNIAEAEDWLKKASHHGHPDAQYNLANIYLYDQNFYGLESAQFWLREAAELGSIEAQATLGFSLLHLMDGNPFELEENVDEGVYWIKMAAEQGDEECQTFLASMQQD